MTRETLGIFALRRYQTAHVTRLEEAAEGLRLVTDPRQWAHAVEFLPQAAGDLHDASIRVAIEVVVETGEIQVGALSETGTTFLSESRVGPGRHVVELAIGSVARCRSLVVRNASVSPSVVLIRNLSDWRDEATADSPEGLDLAAPYGTSARGFWDKNIFADVRRLAGQEARTVFHVGAHHGGDVERFRKLFTRAEIHCFEPAPPAFAALEQTYQGADRIVLHRCALGDAPGEVPFYVNEADETSSLYAFAKGAHRHITVPRQGLALPVRQDTVDEMVGRLALERLDVLSLDVQGAEVSALRGARRTLEQKRVGVLLAELIFIPLYDGQAAAHEVLACIAELGYRVYDFYNFAYGDSGQLLWGDVLALPPSAEQQ